VREREERERRERGERERREREVTATCILDCEARALASRLRGPAFCCTTTGGTPTLCIIVFVSIR